MTSLSIFYFDIPVVVVDSVTSSSVHLNCKRFGGEERIHDNMNQDSIRLAWVSFEFLYGKVSFVLFDRKGNSAQGYQGQYVIEDKGVKFENGLVERLKAK